MRAPDRLPPEVRQCLGQHRNRAGQARAALVRDLAGRSLAQLSELPTRTWDRLGPKGVVALIGASRELAHLRLPPPPAVDPRARPPAGGHVARVRERLAHWRAVRPLPVVTAMALLRGGGAAILLAVAALPAREFATRAGWVGRPAACPRLDRWTGGCTYTVRADGLSLDRLAAALGRSSADLATANPDRPSGRLLRHGTTVVIPPRPLLDTTR